MQDDTMVYNYIFGKLKFLPNHGFPRWVATLLMCVGKIIFESFGKVKFP